MTGKQFLRSMPSSPDNHEAHDYAERIRARLPRRLQELREAAGMSKYALEQASGISREMIGRTERGKAIPSIIVVAQMSFGAGHPARVRKRHHWRPMATP